MDENPQARGIGNFPNERHEEMCRINAPVFELGRNSYFALKKLMWRRAYDDTTIMFSAVRSFSDRDIDFRSFNSASEFWLVYRESDGHCAIPPLHTVAATAMPLMIGARFVFTDSTIMLGANMLVARE